MPDESRSRSRRNPAAFLRPLPQRAAAVADAVCYAGGLLLRHAPGAGGALFAFAVVGGATTPLVVFCVQRVTDALVAGAGAGTGDGAGTPVPVPAVDWARVGPWLALLAGALLVRGLDGAVTDYLVGRVREPVDAALLRRLYAHAAAVPLAALEQQEYHTRLENGRRALGGRLANALRDLAALLGRLTGLLGLLGLFLAAHPVLALVLTAVAAVRSSVTAQQMRRFLEISYARSPERRALAYWSGLLTSREAAPELRAFGLGGHLMRRWRALFDRHAAELAAARRRHALGSFANGAAQELLGWLVVAALVALGAAGAITAGSVVALLYGANRFREVLNSLSYSLQQAVENWTMLAHLRGFLALPPEVLPTAPAPPPRPLRDDVRFEDVSFTYPGAARLALEGVTLALRPGERIALVGENGAGKTTLVRLLLGLYRPTAGRIMVDGVDLREIDPAGWRHEVTAVFQDFVRYPATAAENVGYADVTLLGDPTCWTAPASGAAGSPGPGGPYAPHPRIEAAARRSGAHEVVASLPRGYATLLSKDFEDGAELSAGQWQKLALARAYLRDAQLVVLDEPTAALDPRAEVEVYRRFAEAAGGRCAVFISHRLGSARLADRIVVLKDGRVVEEGNHAALVARGGEYARLFSLQASWYADTPAGADESGAPLGAAGAAGGRR